MIKENIQKHTFVSSKEITYTLKKNKTEYLLNFKQTESKSKYC